MPTKVVVGVQWGDEGKGKIIDILASRAEVVVRSQGGNNAGHTVENNGEVYKLQLIPSGILYPSTQCLLGSGVVINPQGILGEIDGLESRGICCDHLRIDPRAHIIMPWHLVLDGLSEKMRGKSEIGTTKKGIGPCYMDKAERSGLRIYDLVHPEVLAEKVRISGEIKNRLLVDFYKEAPLDLDAIIEEYTAYGQRLKKYVADVSVLAYNAIKANKEVLFEGAQGTLLDIDFGTYPYVTSSHPVSGGVCVGSGIGPTLIDEVIGAAKAYTTRVGMGPFPTELFDEMGDTIRTLGHEFGTVTGRPRRCGWFDSVIMRHSVRVNGLTALAINKIDTLSNLGSLKVCVAYKKADGTVIRDFPATIEELAECQPIYEEIDGFEGDLTGCRNYDELPASCKRYIEKLEQICECPVKMVGVGPSRDQNLER
ncbi:adenylosuccinate synthase [Oscillospiraceae bacterium PP1C4]